VTSRPAIIDLGRRAYADAYGEQVRHVVEVLAARRANPEYSDAGRVLLVEHEPVITVSRRPSSAQHLVATPEQLAHAGVTVAETDRGGDITYHGPGQLVVYPILDLNALNLGLHDYMRMLEDTVIGACARFGVSTMRDPGATGVWTGREGRADAKIAALGVRVRRWVSMHGLALNVTTNLDHFGLIVPCGLHGRAVTSLERELGAACPPMGAAKAALVEELVSRVLTARERARARRADGSSVSSS
jgi:lipoyl(octanoyl) transferase